MSSSIAPLASSIPGIAPVAAPRPPANLAALAVDLAGESSVVSLLGGAGNQVQLYDAQGLLNSFRQAGATPSPAVVPPAGSDTQTSARDSLDQAILGAPAAGSAVASGEYSGTGGVPNLPSGGTPTDWAGILKNDPGAAGAVIADSFAQGILATL
ncbi:hypothetical protein [Janthinobacterium sp.]|uniref:hypothetical protein n=1 Tax=Janthinobacterium sp. TaxID=1871054 RepID=UPI00293D7EA8|nr:hypothetical protein [Janthinobacterium sp.]